MSLASSLAGARPVRRCRALAWAAAQSALALPPLVSVGVAAAWLLMIEHGILHGAHAHHAVMTPAQELAGWIAMVVAMMVPTLGGNLRDLARRSYRERRARAAALYVATYLGVWTLAGVPVVVMRACPALRDLRVAAVAFAIGALWASAPAYERLVVACHRKIPLAPAGWSADRSAIAQAVVAVLPCVATCGAMMTGCALTGHRLVPMIAGATITIVQMHQFRVDARPAIAGCALLAGWCLLPPA